MPKLFSTLLISLLTGIIIYSLFVFFFNIRPVFAQELWECDTTGDTFTAEQTCKDACAGGTCRKLSGSSTNTSTWIFNPLKVETVRELINLILNYLLVIAIPLSTIVIVYAAMLFMISGGDPKRVGTARKTLFYAVIGIAILLIAKGITFTIAKFFEP